MHFCKILILTAVGLLFTNARVIKQRRQRRVRQRPTSCGCSIPLIDTPCLEPCCQNLYLEELSNRPICGCQYKDISCTYNNPELPNYGRMSVILPKMSAAPLPVCYDTEVLPAIYLPEIVSLPGLGMPGFVTDLPCPRQVPVTCQCLDIPCGCRTQMPVVEYMSSVPRTILPAPISEPCIQGPKCQSIPCCDSQNLPCNCQNMCGGRSMPCGYKNTPCDYLNLPCGCQNILCGCQNLPCDCQNMPCSCQTLPCSCLNVPCGCMQNVIQYGPQLPAVELPCACQACQLAPIELPVYSCGCQMLPPPVMGCCGKYLRQITLQPPFL